MLTSMLVYYSAKVTTFKLVHLYMGVISYNDIQVVIINNDDISQQCKQNATILVMLVIRKKGIYY